MKMLEQTRRRIVFTQKRISFTAEIAEGAEILNLSHAK